MPSLSNPDIPKIETDLQPLSLSAGWRWAELQNSILLFAGFYALGFMTHVWALHLSYYWDEAGYFVPAALDIFHHGWWVPRTTLANGHPPLVMAVLALAWRLAGLHRWVTRAVMLGFYSLLLTGVARLGGIYGRTTAMLAPLLAGLAPLIFAQAPLALLDLPAAAFIVWAVYLRQRRRIFAYIACTALACITKETAAIVPAALAVHDMVAWLRRVRTGSSPDAQTSSSFWAACRPHILAIVPLLAWLGYYHARTGYWMGNPEFLAYNLPLAPLALLPRFSLVVVQRLWQLFVYNGAWLLVLSGWWGWRRHSGRNSAPVPLSRDIAWLVATYLLVHSLIGGAILARYLLPAQALLYVWLAAGLEKLPRRLWQGLAVFAISALFILHWFWRPPYPFPYEDNLSWASFVRLQQRAARHLAEFSHDQPILTAWPASQALSEPALGYVRRPLRVVQINNFNQRSLRNAPAFAVALLYSRQYQPDEDSLPKWLLPARALWRGWLRRYFHYQPPLSLPQLLSRLHSHPIWQAHADGQWIAIARAQP